MSDRSAENKRSEATKDSIASLEKMIAERWVQADSSREKKDMGGEEEVVMWVNMTEKVKFPRDTGHS